jgi:GNAT superfamily N-acetyltransferase
VTDARIRPATGDDVPAIVALLADDALGAGRESPDDLTQYLAAFAVIDRDRHQQLVVADRDTRIVGTLQLTIIPGLSRRAATRGQLEGVRVHSGERGGGLGRQLVTWAVEEARDRGCSMVQLTSDLDRGDAHRFYERFGFAATHVGFKLDLT